MPIDVAEPSASESVETSSGSARRRRPQLSLAALVWAALALAPGCVLAPGDELGVVVQDLNANSRAAFDYFLARGLTPVQAAGIVGNLMQESNCDPAAVQPGGPGRGIAQWSVGGRWDHDAGDNATAYASSHGASVWSLTLQLDFIWFELTSFSGYGLAALRAATTVSAATIAFQNRFEGCGTCVETQRLAYANQALAAYATDAASTWGASFVSQSFPYASAGAVTITAGRTASVSITMRNSGTHAWDSRTCIGTTVPRDRTSPFAGPEWPGPNRRACVPAGTTVASGANHTFTWTMHAPATAGRYDEHWGMLEEGTAWFSDSGQGGPPDTDLEGIFTVVAAPPPVDAGTPDAGTRDAGADVVSTVDVPVIDDAGNTDDAPAPTTDAAPARDAAADAADASAGHEGGMTGAAVDGGCGCRVAGPNTADGAGARAWIFAVGLVAARRRRFGTGVGK